jgi:hypothetical protein
LCDTIADRVLSIGSIYSGIAGLELGLLAAYAEAGIPARVTWQCERTVDAIRLIGGKRLMLKTPKAQGE